MVIKKIEYFKCVIGGLFVGPTYDFIGIKNDDTLIRCGTSNGWDPWTPISKKSAEDVVKRFSFGPECETLFGPKGLAAFGERS